MTARERLDWLANHLQVYAGRVSALAARADTSMRTLVASDLFTSVEAGADAVAAELRSGGAPGTLRARWLTVDEHIAELRRSSDREEATELRHVVAAWREALATAPWAPAPEPLRPTTPRRSRA